MAITNKAKLQEAQKQIGRYQKKVGDLMKENARLAEKYAKAERTFLAAAEGVKAPLVQAAITYGEKGTDPDTGKEIPNMYRLTLPRYDAGEIVRSYEIRSRYDAESDSVVIAVGLRDDPGDNGEESEGDNGTDKQRFV